MKKIKEYQKKLMAYITKYIRPQSIQMTISISFTVVAVLGMGTIGVSLYNRFVNQMQDMTIESSEQLLN